MNQAMMMKLRKMQKELEQAQAKLQETVFTGQAGGVVTVSVKGSHEVVGVKIDTSVIEDKDDLEILEDSIVSALNDANKKIEEASQKILGPYASMTGGLF